MKVSQEDLQFVVNVMKGKAEASDCDHSSELVDALREELLSLRCVAECARMFSGAVGSEAPLREVVKLGCALDAAFRMLKYEPIAKERA